MNLGVREAPGLETGGVVVTLISDASGPSVPLTGLLRTTSQNMITRTLALW